MNAYIRVVNSGDEDGTAAAPERVLQQPRQQGVPTYMIWQHITTQNKHV